MRFVEPAGDRITDETGPLFGQDAADLGRELVSASVAADTDIVREALREIWVEEMIDHWLEARNAHLAGVRPVDVLNAHALPRVMDAVCEEIQRSRR